MKLLMQHVAAALVLPLKSCDMDRGETRGNLRWLIAPEPVGLGAK